EEDVRFAEADGERGRVDLRVPVLEVVRELRLQLLVEAGPEVVVEHGDVRERLLVLVDAKHEEDGDRQEHEHETRHQVGNRYPLVALVPAALREGAQCSSLREISTT